MSLNHSEKTFRAPKVPEITALFWAMKLLTTGMGESMSDFMGNKSVPIAGAVGIFGLLLALRLQLRQREYRAPYYWFLVTMVAIFGTMVADAIHDAANIPYTVTTPVFALMTGIVFWRWYRSEGTLSIHSITTPRRERYYWAAVGGTFALGTAAGDMTAASLHLGFFDSVLVFSAIIAIPALGWRRFNMNPILAFWFAYVDTRPIGASVVDWLGKSTRLTGLHLGDGNVSGCSLVLFLALLAYATLSGHGRQPRHRHAHPRLRMEPHRQPLLASETE